ncbi:hypothetical protein ACUS6K_34670, partial [Pseudomonas aeruginosa]|uniref:hypothetical protein n=1 Tax=Pseudomonas aeruginosa TaxID=287 RepID=UPI004053CADF
AGLLALAGVLGIGEGHLLHQKTRWGGVRLFCQNQKVFFRLSLSRMKFCLLVIMSATLLAA